MTPANAWAKSQILRLRAARGNACEDCGRSLRIARGKPNLQFAHLQPTGLSGEGRGRKERVIDIRRHPESYKLLCVDCHLSFDAQEGAR